MIKFRLIVFDIITVVIFIAYLGAQGDTIKQGKNNKYDDFFVFMGLSYVFLRIAIMITPRNRLETLTRESYGLV